MEDEMDHDKMYCSMSFQNGECEGMDGMTKESEVTWNDQLRLPFSLWVGVPGSLPLEGEGKKTARSHKGQIRSSNQMPEPISSSLSQKQLEQ